jgi:hypothetical protein
MFHCKIRAVFYNSAAGIGVDHTWTNKKTSRHLGKWPPSIPVAEIRRSALRSHSHLPGLEKDKITRRLTSGIAPRPQKAPRPDIS